jgi:hypothetical protein
VERLQYHGVTMLLDRALSGAPEGDSWPAVIRETCRDEARTQALLEMVRRAELARVLQAFADAGIEALLLKGTPLAYSHYDSPVLRPRGDTDVLVPLSFKSRAEEVLGNLGYSRFLGVRGDFISYQSLWSLTDRLGVAHDVDLHWRVHNSQVLARLLDYDELVTGATALPQLCAHAHALSPVHALLFACMHRSGHRNAPYYVGDIAYPASDRLIWVYDIHLLVSRMSEEELAEFAELAARKRMRTICLDGLTRSATCFGTRVPDSVMKILSQAGPVEPSARYCSGGPRSQWVDDFLALGSIGARARWMGEMAFPPVDYMREKYGDAGGSWLPFLYVRRAFGGLWRLALSGGGSGGGGGSGSH